MDHYQTTSLFWSWLLFRLKSPFLSDISLDQGLGLNWLWQNMDSKIFHPQNSLCSYMLLSFAVNSKDFRNVVWSSLMLLPKYYWKDSFFWLMLYVAGKTTRMRSAILYQLAVFTASGPSCVSVVDCCSLAKRMERCRFLRRAEMSQRNLQGNLWPLDSMSTSHLCCDS